MKSNFKDCLRVTLGYEGGISNHPKDPGGLTNKGVTQRVYTAYRKGKGVPERSVRELTELELQDIYRKQYWAQVGGDELPAGLDLVLFDYAVNSGAGKAVKDLQRELNVVVDGVAGIATASAVVGRDTGQLVNAMCDRRLGFMRSLKGWGTFGNGWGARVLAVRGAALAMVQGTVPVAVKLADVQPKAIVATQAKLRTAEGAGLSTAALGTAGQGLMTTAQQLQPQIGDSFIGRAAAVVFITLIAVGGLLVAFSYFRRMKEAGGFESYLGSLFSGKA